MLNKEMIQMIRDKRIFILIFFSPLIELIIFGYAINLDIKDIETGVLDFSRSYYSRDLVELFNHSDKFKIVKEFSSMFELEESFKRREIQVGIIIPSKFSDDLMRGKQGEVLILFDGTDANTCRIALGYFDQVKVQFTKYLFKERGIMPFNLSDYAKVRVRYNPYMRTVNFLMSGIIGSILLVITMVLGSANLVREKESGTYEQLITTPLKPIEILTAKFLPFFIIGYINVVFIVLVAIYLFKTPLRGSFGLLLIMVFPFLLSTFGTGLFVSSISENQRQAMFTSVIFMIPNILLSGFLFPIENMPKIIQYITYAIPFRYFLVIIRGIFMKGSDLSDFYQEAIYLTLFGIVIFIFSLIFTNKQKR